VFLRHTRVASLAGSRVRAVTFVSFAILYHIWRSRRGQLNGGTKCDGVAEIIQMYLAHISSRLPPVVTDLFRALSGVRYGKASATNACCQIPTIHGILSVSFDVM
jgi:hypothetical protein